MNIFISHTRRDRKFCDEFDVVVAREPIGAFRSEFEKFDVPPWKTIKQSMENSSAMFLLVGKELVEFPILAEEDDEIKERWKHTQHWIAYEIGLACQLGIDVWVMCDGVKINFPVPYVNNYQVTGISSDSEKMWLRTKLKRYIEGGSYPIGYDKNNRFACIQDSCGIEFNLHNLLDDDDTIICPTCLKEVNVGAGKSLAKSKYIAELEERIQDRLN